MSHKISSLTVFTYGNGVVLMAISRVKTFFLVALVLAWWFTFFKPCVYHIFVISVLDYHDFIYSCLFDFGLPLGRPQFDVVVWRQCVNALLRRHYCLMVGSITARSNQCFQLHTFVNIFSLCLFCLACTVAFSLFIFICRYCFPWLDIFSMAVRTCLQACDTDCCSGGATGGLLWLDSDLSRCVCR